MPNRQIKDSARTSPTLDLLSDGAERFFWRLILVADDFGRFDADPRILLALCFPLRVSRLDPETVAGYLAECVSAGLVSTYEANGHTFGYLVSWRTHQRIRSERSKFPEPPKVPIRRQPGTFGHLTATRGGVRSDDSGVRTSAADPDPDPDPDHDHDHDPDHDTSTVVPPGEPEPDRRPPCSDQRGGHTLDSHTARDGPTSDAYDTDRLRKILARKERPPTTRRRAAEPEQITEPEAPPDPAREARIAELRRQAETLQADEIDPAPPAPDPLPSLHAAVAAELGDRGGGDLPIVIALAVESAGLDRELAPALVREFMSWHADSRFDFNAFRGFVVGRARGPDIPMHGSEVAP